MHISVKLYFVNLKEHIVLSTVKKSHLLSLIDVYNSVIIYNIFIRVSFVITLEVLKLRIVLYKHLCLFCLAIKGRIRGSAKKGREEAIL